MKRWGGLLVLASLLVGASGCQWFTARDELNKGITAYKSQQYPLAVTHFKAATAADPDHVVARLYLATSYATQYVPGLDSPENQANGENAIAEFQKVLDKDSGNLGSISGIASMYFQMKRMDQAKDFYKKQIELDPQNPEPYYSIAVINWTITYQARQILKNKLGYAPDAPIRDAKERQALAERNQPLIDEGMEALNKAMQLRAEYDDAMAYLNLLYREKADLADTPEQREEMIATANSWIDKAVEIKRVKAERAAKKEQDNQGG